MERAFHILVLGVGTAALLLSAGGLLIRLFVQDARVPLLAPIVPAALPQRAMFVFPHPDDEISVAGTMSVLDAEGVETTLVTLTKGERGLTDGLVEQHRLGATRARELVVSARILGVDHLEIFDFPDAHLASSDPEAIKRAIHDLILAYRPSIIITYDERVGFYGHPDHRSTAAAVRAVVEKHEADPGFPVKSVFAVTLPRRMIDMAKKLSPQFRTRYPANPDDGLPRPDFAVRITDHCAAKRDAMLAHRTQRRAFAGFYPLHEMVPACLYFRVFDREYFARLYPKGGAASEEPAGE